MSAFAKPAPPLSIPASDQCCRLSIIDSTCLITVPTKLLIQPKADGYDWINLPDYAYHVKHDKTGRELLFDLGTRKDWWNSVPHLRELIEKGVPGLSIEKDVKDILPSGNTSIDNIEALVLSHYHFDHCGNLADLPKSVKLYVGPGFRDRFLPGWPSNQESTFHEADFEGRDVIEAPFSGTKIGQFDSYDYFGDGSFYILNVPGHTTGHISALVRTTPDTFVFLGGDSCHFTGVIRPTQYIPLPDQVPSEAVLDKRIPLPCLCSGFVGSHKDPDNFQTSPFFTVSDGPNTFYEDPETARKSVDKLIEFDADPNVLVSIAHDPTPLEVFDFFPATMNDWKQKNWKRANHWGFLSELPYNGKIVRPPLVDGLYRDGQKVRGLEG